MNYFELFGIPPQFEINTQRLKPTFIALSRKYHPDFHTDKDEISLDQTMELSAAVNRGWQVFCNPLATLKYVLEINGKIKEEENAALSTDFLMEMMELNEQLTEGNQSEISVVQEKLKQYENDLYNGVKNLLSNSPSTTSDTDFKKIKEYYHQRKYLERIQERIQISLS